MYELYIGIEVMQTLAQSLCQADPVMLKAVFVKPATSRKCEDSQTERSSGLEEERRSVFQIGAFTDPDREFTYGTPKVAFWRWSRRVLHSLFTL